MLLKTLLIPLILGLGLAEAAETRSHRLERRGRVPVYDYVIHDMDNQDKLANSTRLCYSGNYDLTVTDNPEMFKKVANNKRMADGQKYDCVGMRGGKGQANVFQGHDGNANFFAWVDTNDESNKDDEKNKEDDCKCEVDYENTKVTCPALP